MAGVHRLDRFSDESSGEPVALTTPDALVTALERLAVGLRVIAVALGVTALGVWGHLILLVR